VFVCVCVCERERERERREGEREGRRERENISLFVVKDFFELPQLQILQCWSGRPCLLTSLHVSR